MQGNNKITTCHQHKWHHHHYHCHWHNWYRIHNFKIIPIFASPTLSPGQCTLPTTAIVWSRKQNNDGWSYNDRAFCQFPSHHRLRRRLALMLQVLFQLTHAPPMSDPNGITASSQTHWSRAQLLTTCAPVSVYYMGFDTVLSSMGCFGNINNCCWVSAQQHLLSCSLKRRAASTYRHAHNRLRPSLPLLTFQVYYPIQSLRQTIKWGKNDNCSRWTTYLHRTVCLAVDMMTDNVWPPMSGMINPTFMLSLNDIWKWK